MTTLELTDEEAGLFLEFQKHYKVVAPIVGYMSSLKLVDLSNTQVVLDIGQTGLVQHMAITKHYRQ